MLTSIFQSTKDASIELALLDGDTINSIHDEIFRQVSLCRRGDGHHIGC